MLSLRIRNEEKKAEKHKSRLLAELKRLAEASEDGNFNIKLHAGSLSGEDTEIIRLINQSVNHYRFYTEYNLMKYKLASDALGVALWDMDVMDGDPVNPGNCFTWSQEFRCMLGFADERDFPNVLRSWSDRLHPRDKKRTLDAFATHLNDRTGRAPYDLEYRLMLKNGQYRSFHAFGATLRDANGAPLRVAGALKDVTEEKQKREELETNDLRFRLLLKSMKVALWDMVVDPEDPISGNNEAWWSDDFRYMLGFSGEHDFSNVLQSWSDRLHPEDKEQTLNALAAHLMDYSGNTPYRVKYRIRKKSGEYMLTKAGGATLRSPNGMPIRFVGSAEDISHEAFTHGDASLALQTQPRRLQSAIR